MGRPKSRWEDDVRNDLRKMKLIKWVEQVRIASNERILLRKPRLYQSCSAEEEEEEDSLIVCFLYRIMIVWAVSVFVTLCMRGC